MLEVFAHIRIELGDGVWLPQRSNLGGYGHEYG
jgi:hypothetical protein